MSDYNTAALAEHEHKTDRDQERWDMWARSARSSLLQEMITDRPEDLLTVINDYGVEDLVGRDRVLECIMLCNDAGLGVDLMEAACKKWKEGLSDETVWDMVRAMEERE